MAKVRFSVNIPVSILKEGNRYVAYTPALDLATSGKTYQQTKNRFEEIITIFLAEIVKDGTVDDVLSDLGWQKIKTNNTFPWTPPVIVSQDMQLIQV